ncbi:MAG TPA: Ppx/GppA phosphatase family protein [Bryocella sp.]|nr:Ppx/GppA phosphatase family protein [Bryocella sp.]
MPTFAAIDIGSNSVRLKIANVMRGRLKTLHEDREVTRLGESVFADGALDPQAMAHTLRVLRRFHRATQTYAADRVRAVATSALRDARNTRAFVDWVRTATGWKVEVISGLEEGRLIHLGVLANSRLANARALFIDLGGGSCELTISIDGHIDDMISLPIGAVRLTQTFLHHDPPWHSELQQMRAVIQREVSRIRKRIVAAGLQITIATSGTPATLSSLYAAKRRGYDDTKPQTVPQNAVTALAEDLSRRNLAQRQSLPGIGPRRAEIIIAGAMVFAELMQLCKLRSFRYLPLGLRDGLLAQMMADYHASEAMRERVESERHDALLAAAKHYGADLPFAQHIRDLTMELFRRLQSVHQLPPEYANWLEAAAMLHEVGAYINRSGRRRHTHYVISNSEIFGYTPLQRRIIAAIARYVGKSLPSPSDRVMRLLPGIEQIHVAKAVSLLRLARALDQGRRAAVAEVKIRVHHDGRVRLMLKPGSSEGIDLELWAVEQEKNYFETAFGRELLAEAC